MAGRMISVYHLKPRFQSLLRPIAYSLAAIGVTANQVTIAAAAGSLASARWSPRAAIVRRSCSSRCGCCSAWPSTPSTACWRASSANRAGSAPISTSSATSSPTPRCTCRSPDCALRPAWRRRWSSCSRLITEFAGVLGPMVGASRRYDGPMGKSDRAFVFGALGPVDRRSACRCRHWACLADAAARRPAGRHDRQPRPRRPAEAERCRPQSRHDRRDVPRARVEEGHFPTHDGIAAVLPLTGRPSPGRRRGAVVLFHRGHEHGGRMAHLVDELDLPDFAFFAWDARGHGRSPGERGYSAEPRRLGARRADLHRRTSRGARLRHRGHRGHRAERRRGAGRDLGARLRARHPRAWCWPRRPSRSSCTCRSPAPGSR